MKGWKCPRCGVLYWAKPLEKKCVPCDVEWEEVDEPIIVLLEGKRRWRNE